MTDYAEEGLVPVAREDECKCIEESQREQMLRTVARNFYNELVRYGIEAKDVIQVSTCLLDCLLTNGSRPGRVSTQPERTFTLGDVKDEWAAQKRLGIDDVTITPLTAEAYPQVASWLANPLIRDSFISPFPDTAEALRDYFGRQDRFYFAVLFKDALAGIIGADHVDPTSDKLEMRKFIGDAELRGKGIGKRCVFLYLYYCFMVLGIHKVYLYSRDSNIRNINLNTKMGFQLEGVFCDEIVHLGKRLDVVRMGLLRPQWIARFS